MSQYRKLIAFIVGVVVQALADSYDIRIPWTPEAVTEVVIVLATGVGIWWVRNEPPRRRRR